MTTADDKFYDIFPIVFDKSKVWYFMRIVCQQRILKNIMPYLLFSHEISCLICYFCLKKKNYWKLYVALYGLIFHAFCRLRIFSKSTFREILSGILSKCQTVLIQIRPDKICYFHNNFLSSADFFKITLLENFFQQYHQSVKKFGSRPGPTFCRVLSGFKLFAIVISERHYETKS